MADSTDIRACDAVIIGGGVCGLWTLRELVARGLDAILIESDALGAGQTNASQGILHAGVKYRLPGNTADSSKAVAEVQPVWAGSLASERLIDLAAVSVRSSKTYLWTLPSLGARAVAAGASASMRSASEKLAPGDRPAVFDGAPRGVEVYAAVEPVLDPSSLVAALAGPMRERCVCASVESVEQDDGCAILHLRHIDGVARVRTPRVVLAAGGGNADLLAACGGDVELQQRRPLHMVLALDAPAVLHGHCLQASDKPALTVTTGEIQGRRTWYLGGDLAERGVERSVAEQVDAAHEALRRCLGWIDTASLDVRTLRVDRTEGRMPNGRRPDGPAVVRVSHGPDVIAVWPTKLVLAPVAAERVLAELGVDGPAAERVPTTDVTVDLPLASVAAPVW